MLPVPHDLTRGRYIFETAHSLSKIADVRVFFMQQRYPKILRGSTRSALYGLVDENYRLDGIQMETFSYPALPLITRSINGFIASQVLKPRLKKYQPDIVLAYWVYPDGYAALKAAESLRLPCVVGALGSDIHVRSGHNAVMTRKTIARVDALLTVSENMRQVAMRDFDAAAAKVHTIVNGFNTSVFKVRPRNEARAALGLSQGTKVLVYVGRLVEAKGLKELIQAFKALTTQFDNLKLVLVGDGVMKQELEAYVAETGITSQVHMTGGQTPEQVAQWIAASDLLTLPSWSEGYPNVVVEAVACGRPVVATDVGGTCEIVNEKNGVLVPPRNASALSEALAQVLTRPWDADAISATLHRSWDDVAVDTLDVCERLLRSKT
jgi:glycosyltransferase involved in cell wall biosynthesis